MRVLLALVFLVCIGRTPLYSQFVSQEIVLEDGQGSGLKNSKSIHDGYGGFYLAGSQNDAFGLLVHVDSLLTVLSSTIYSGGAWPNIFPDMIFDDIERLHDGNLILCGQVTDTVTGKVNALLMECDSAGNALWARQLSGTGLYSRFSAVSICPDGGLVCTGNLYNPITTQPGQLLVTRTDSSGQVQWSKAFTGLNHENSGREVQVLADGGYLLTGFTENLNPYEGCALLMKLDSAGNAVQSVRIGISSPLPFAFCAGSDMVNTTSGPVLYLSTSSGTALIRIDSSFQTLQARSFSGSGPGGGFSPKTYPGFHIVSCSDGGGILTTRNGFSGEMAKVDSAGNLEWSRQALMLLNDVHLQSDGSMLLIGEGPLFGVIPPSDPMMQVSLLPQIGLQRTDSLALAGNCLQPGITTNDPTIPTYFISPLPISVITTGSMQPVSVTSNTVSVLTRSGCVDMLGGVDEMVSGSTLQIFPNPASENFTIDHDLKGVVRMVLTDIRGRKLMERTNIPAGNRYTMDTPHPGMYIITVDNGKKRVTGRLVVVK